MNITGATLISRFLDRQGIAGYAGVAGETLKPLLRALRETPLRELPQTRAAVCLADNDAALAALAPLADSGCNLCIAGQVPRAQIGSAQWQRQHAMNFAKAWFHVGAAYELLELLPLAFRVAHNDQPGLVVLEVPEDVQTEIIEGAWLPAPVECAPPTTTLFQAWRAAAA